jgi:hypothetical protein
MNDSKKENSPTLLEILFVIAIMLMVVVMYYVSRRQRSPSPPDSNQKVYLRFEGSGAGVVLLLHGDKQSLCRATCQLVVPASTPVEMRAISDISSRFVGWSGDCASNAVHCLPHGGNVVVSFAKKRYEERER